MKIIELNKDDILNEPITTWIKDQRLLFQKPIEIISMLWSGVYKGYLGLDDGNKPVGMIVCKFDKTECTTIMIHAKNELMTFREMFYSMLRALGITKVRTFSHHRSDAYERLIDMKHVYSYYEKEL